MAATAQTCDAAYSHYNVVVPFCLTLILISIILSATYQTRTHEAHAISGRALKLKLSIYTRDLPETISSSFFTNFPLPFDLDQMH
jgi:hypothetical protein